MPAFDYYIMSDIGGRTENQDFVLTLQTSYGFVMIVCDGMGGANGGRLASETAANCISDFFKNYQVTNYDDERAYFLGLLRRAVALANHQVFSLGRSNPELHGMGTTVCVALLRGSKVYLGHVGDSRIYHLHGKQFRHTEDHSRVFELFKNDILTKEQARTHPESNIITRALGIREEIEGNFEEVSVTQGNRLILCTDGIWGVFPEKALINKFNSKTTLQRLCEEVISEINHKYEQEGKRHDNLSIGIIQINEIDPTSTEIRDLQENINQAAPKQKIKEANISSSQIGAGTYVFVLVLLMGVIGLLLFVAGVFNKNGQSTIQNIENVQIDTIEDGDNSDSISIIE